MMGIDRFRRIGEPAIGRATAEDEDDTLTGCLEELEGIRTELEDSIYESALAPVISAAIEQFETTRDLNGAFLAESPDVDDRVKELVW